MKKLFLFSAVAAVLGLASCNSDDLVVGNGEEVKVTYQIGLPSQIASRAYGEAVNVTDLYYAVYATGDNTVLFEDKVTAFGPGDLTENVELNLVTGKSYDIVFWADAQNSPYTYDKDTQTIKVDYTGVKNGEETRDAFFGQVKNFTVTGPMAETVELRRPFAQLNIGTDDLDKVRPAVTKAEVTVPVYDQVNLLTGAVSNQDGTAEAKDVTFALDVFPADEDFPVAGYDYMAMNYLLVNTRELVKVTMTTDDTTVAPLVYDNVPVQRNYRTNIYGSLLTSPTIFNVIIKPEFFEPDYDNYVAVATAAELLSAIKSGEGNYVLTDDIDLSSEAALTNGLLANNKELVLDLNGNTLDCGSNRVWAYGADSNIEFKNGTVVVNDNRGLLAQAGGTIDVDNATIKTTQKYSVNAQAGSTVNVSNSTIKVEADPSTKPFAAVAKDGTVVLENVTVEGGMLCHASKSGNNATTTASAVLKNVTAVVETGVQSEYGASLEIEDCNISVTKPSTRNVVSAITLFDKCDISVKGATLNCPKGYGISTNASDPLTVTAVIDNCNINALVGVMMNEPGTMALTNTTIKGSEHTFIARGGNITFEGCELILNSDGYYTSMEKAQADQNTLLNNAEWPSGANVPMSVLTMGTKNSSAYQYPTNVTFYGNNSLSTEGSIATALFPVIYAYANPGDGMGVTFTYPVATTTFTGIAPIYASSNIVVNGSAM